MEIVINNSKPTPSLGYDDYVIVKAAGNDLLVINRTNAGMFFEIKSQLESPAGIIGAWIDPDDSKVVKMYGNYKLKGKVIYIKYSLYEVITKPRKKKVKLNIEKYFGFIYQ